MYGKYKEKAKNLSHLGDDHLILRWEGPSKFGRDRLVLFIGGSAGKFISG